MNARVGQCAVRRGDREERRPAKSGRRLTSVQWWGTLGEEVTTNMSSVSRTSHSANQTPLPSRITRYPLAPEHVPADFFADPDGAWDFDSLVELAGFNPEAPGASVGALLEPFDGYPAGAAVITVVGVGCRFVAIAQLPGRDLVFDGSPREPEKSFRGEPLRVTRAA